MADPEVRIRRASADDVDALLTISAGLWREDAGTHDPEVMNTDWPAQHGRESFEALAQDPDRVTAFTANPAAIQVYELHGFGSHTVTLRTPL